MNVEEIFTSIGASSLLFILYKAAKTFYYKYYINSECHNISDTATKIEITISKEHQEEHQEHHEKKDEEKDDVGHK